MSQRGYRILSYKENRNGTRIVFDILDGTVYNCGTGAGKKITYNAVVFDSKRSALSERFPSNQVVIMAFLSYLINLTVPHFYFVGGW